MPSMSENFEQCFCWNTVTNTWCHGNNFWQQQACQDYTIDAAAWAIPAILIAVIAIFFPCFFCLGRYACNCCGGKNPTRGCCCPGTSDRDRRVYHNTSIMIAKICYCAAFGGLIYYGVGVFTSNADVNNGVIDVADTLRNTTEDVFGMLNKTHEAVFNLSLAGTNHRGFPNPDNVVESATIASQFATREQEIFDACDLIKQIENGVDNSGASRSQLVYQIPGCVLLVALIGFVLMLCNVRSPFVAIMWLMSWGICLLLVLFTAHIVIAQVTTPLCNNYNDTFVPVVVGAIETQGGCNNDDLTNVINSTAVSFQNYVTDPTSAVCQAIRLLCDGDAVNNIPATFNCPANPCSAWLPTFPSTTYPIAYYANISQYNIPNVSIFDEFLHTATAKTNNNTCGSRYGSPCTPLACADACTVGDLAIQLQQSCSFLREIYSQYQAPINYLVWTSMPQNFNCSEIRSVLYDRMHDNLCNELAPAVMSLAVTLGCTSICAMLVSLAAIRGIKRFNAMSTSVQNALRQTVYVADAQANGAKAGSLDDLGNANAPVTAVVAKQDFFITATGEKKVTSAASATRFEDLHPLLHNADDRNHADESTALVGRNAADTESMATINSSVAATKQA